MTIYIYDETDTFISAWGLGLYIERLYFLFVTYLIISRYRKAQT